MKLAVLGKGMIVKDFLKTVPDLPIESMVLYARPESKESALKFAAENGFQKVFFDYDELLKEDLDAIYVALPNVQHYPYSLKALKAGKNVICEKPAVTNTKELDSLISAARENHVMFLEAMTVWHLPSFQALQKELPKLGQLRMARLAFNRLSSRYEQYCRGIIHPAFDVNQAGGAMMDLNVYNISAAVGMFGEPNSCAYYPNIVRGVDTSGASILSYSGFQVICTAAKDCSEDLGFSIQGNLGCIRGNKQISLFDGFDCKIFAGESTHVDCAHGHMRMFYEFRDFERIIREKDYTEMERLLGLTRIVTQVMERCRLESGIRFPTDE